MASMARMTDMRQTLEDKIEGMMPPEPDVANDYSPRHCISLDDGDLEKLDLDGDVEKGDMIHFTAMATVCSVSDGPMGKRVELQITHFGFAEDENTEELGED